MWKPSIRQTIADYAFDPFNTIYLNALNTGLADGTALHPFPTLAAALAAIGQANFDNVTIEMGTGTYSYTGDITFDIPLCIHGNGSSLAISGTTTINSVHQIYDLHTTGAIVYAYTGSTRSTRNGGSINGTVTIQGGFPHFENLNYTDVMTITGGNPYFRGLTGGGRITLNGADVVLTVSDCNMDMTLAQANITVTAGQLIVNGGLFTNSGTTPNIVFNNTNYTDLSKAHMLSGVVANYSVSCGNAFTIVAPTCITALTGNVITPTPVIPAFGVGGGTAQVQTATVSIFATAYFSGLRFSVVLAATNTATNPTMNLNGLGAKTVKSSAGGNLGAGDMQQYAIAEFVYDGTYFRLLNPQGESFITYQAAEVLTGDTWVDGKPIYRKIIAFADITYNTNTVIDATLTRTYIDSIVKCGGYVKHLGAIYPLEYSSTTPATHCFLYSFPDAGLTVYFGSGFSGTHKGHLMVEYTKA